VLPEKKLKAFDTLCTTYGIPRTTAIEWLIERALIEQRLAVPEKDFPVSKE
jgi:hypothetical protein